MATVPPEGGSYKRFDDPADRHVSGMVVALALCAAALLRFWALSQGIPSNPGVDEPEVMHRAVRMMKTGDLNPHFFDYPTLYMYMQAAVAIVRFLFGAMAGQWSSLAQVATEDFYLWARGLTAILGTATVWLVYRAGLRWGARTALLAAVMLAVMPIHVRESHYVLTDVPATFFVMLTFLLSLQAHERESATAFALAGVAAGLAGATKYNGVLAILMPLLACALTPRCKPGRLTCAAWIVLSMLAAFVAAAPYTILDLPHFLNQFARLSSEYRAPPISDEPIWLIYMKHLRIASGPSGMPSLQWPGALLVAGGVVFAFWRLARGPNRALWAVTLLFPVVYFRFISNQNIFYGRYLLPLIPFLSLLGAAFIVSSIDWMRRRLPITPTNLATVALTLVAIAPPAYSAIAYNADAAKTWTQELAYEWVKRELPPGTVIRLEGSVSPKLPASYRTSYVKQLRVDGVERYAETDIQYLVASSQCYGHFYADPAQYRAEVADYERIFAQVEEVARFTPDAARHPGPELRILRVKR